MRTASTSASAAASAASERQLLILDRERQLVGQRLQQSIVDPGTAGGRRVRACAARRGRDPALRVPTGRRLVDGSGIVTVGVPSTSPTVARVVHTPSVVPSRRTPERSNVDWICSTAAAPVRDRRARLVVERTSASASSRARRASSERRDARSTSAPTVTATATNTTSADEVLRLADGQRSSRAGRRTS